MGVLTVVPLFIQYLAVQTIVSKAKQLKSMYHAPS